MNAPEQPLSFVPPWQGDGSHRIPFGVYTDAAPPSAALLRQVNEHKIQLIVV